MATATGNFTNSNAVTITLASLANGSTATSSAIDNSTNKFLSALVQVSIRPNATTTAGGYLRVWLLRSADGGTTYDSTAGGSAQLLGVFPLSAVANTVTTVLTFSTEPLGPLGTHWKIAVENQTGQALNASSNAINFTGVKYDVA